MPTGRISSAYIDNVPRAGKKLGLACTTTWAPSVSPPGSASSSATEQVTGSDMSTLGSRRVRKTVRWPGRRVTCVTWPSTQIAPSLLIQPAISWETRRTGTGSSAEVTRDTSGSVGAAEPDLPWRHDPTPGRVLLAAPRGYCAGVDRAVIAVEKALETYGAPVYVRKQIVHNKHVVETLQDRGAIFVEETDEVPEGATVVFSAHGVAPVVHAGGSRPAAQDDRRDLPAGHQGAPRGAPVRR